MRLQQYRFQFGIRCDVEILPDGKTLLDCIQGKDAIGITADFKIDKTLLENAGASIFCTVIQYNM